MRETRYGCATIFTIVGTLFLCCGLVCVQCAPYLAPQGDATDSRIVTVTGTVLVSEDGRSLTMSAPDTDCADHELIAIEYPDRVVVHGIDRAVPLTMCTHAPGYQPPESVTSPVPDPVGGRSIVDSQSGRFLTPVDERHLYRFRGLPPVWNAPATATAVPDFTGPTVAHAYRRTDGAALLWLVQTTGTWAPPATVVRTPVTVRGHPGLAGPGIVAWVENGYTLAIRWDTEPYHLPTTDQLLALSATLVPGEGA